MDYIKVHFKDGRITTAVPYGFLGYYPTGGRVLGWRTKSRSGENWYAVIMGFEVGKPFWIGKQVSNQPGRYVWVTWEKELRVEKLVFENGDEYHFRK